MASKPESTKPWAGRFSTPTHTLVVQFTESVSYDWRLAHYDIMGSIAHARMLAHVGVLSEMECNQLISGLEAIATEIKQERFVWKMELEDVHMNIESALVNNIGEVGKKLHTGRSRNDQVATDLRLYLRDENLNLRQRLVDAMTVILDMAEREMDTVMPGYTHLQSAQPVTFGHHMLAWFEMLYRDNMRLADCYTRINILPLGAGALAGTGYPINRNYTAELLGFESVAVNSLDAVSDRDFVIEYCHCAALIMMHLSRFSEELVLWSSPQFAFIELDDAWCTGSSIMPQKKNPDIPELIRGKCGHVYGHLISLLTLMKGQPLAYNRDNQEDKVALFASVDTVQSCLTVFTGMIPTIVVNAGVMREAAAKGHTTATDLADYLVGKNMPFREAHTVVGKIVQYAQEQKKELSALSLNELQKFCSLIEDNVFKCLTLDGSINARNHIGGTAPAQIRKAIQSGRKRLKQMMKN